MAGNWMGWNGPLFNPHSGVGSDGRNKRADQYTSTVVVIEPGDAPGLHHAIIQVTSNPGFGYIETPEITQVRNVSLRDALKIADRISAPVEAAAERTVRTRYGREKRFSVDREARSDQGGTVGGYRSGGEPDTSAQNW